MPIRKHVKDKEHDIELDKNSKKEINKKVKELKDKSEVLAGKTDNQVAFLELVASGVDKKEAWLLAGYSEKTLKRVNHVLRENKNILTRLKTMKLNEGTFKAIKVIEELLEGSDNDTVRLNAAKYIMELNGENQPQKIEITKKEVTELDHKEIEDEIFNILNTKKEDSDSEESLH